MVPQLFCILKRPLSYVTWFMSTEGSIIESRGFEITKDLLPEVTKAADILKFVINNAKGKNNLIS